MALWSRDSDTTRSKALSAFLRAVAFTVGVCLLIAGSVGVLYGVLTLSGPLGVSTETTSLLALLTFIAFIAVPSYLFAVRAGGTDEEQP